MMDSRFPRDKDIIFDFISDHKITGFCVCWPATVMVFLPAWVYLKALPAEEIRTHLGVEFIQVPLSQQHFIRSK